MFLRMGLWWFDYCYSVYISIWTGGNGAVNVCLFKLWLWVALDDVWFVRENYLGNIGGFWVLWVCLYTIFVYCRPKITWHRPKITWQTPSYKHTTNFWKIFKNRHYIERGSLLILHNIVFWLEFAAILLVKIRLSNPLQEIRNIHFWLLAIGI